jgi:hypothetical protein
MPSRFMNASVSIDPRTSTGQEAGTALVRKGPHRAEPRATPTEIADREASQFFDAAAAAFGPVALAAELEVDDALVSKMRSGAKSTPLRALLPILRDPDAALALLTVMSRYAGLAPPTKPRKVSREEVQEDVAQRVRRCTALWEAFRRQTADALGTTEDDVDLAFGEVGK